jgi:hypothetical protein
MTTFLPIQVAAQETLGRGIFDSRKAAQAGRGKIPPRAFRERIGIRELSVDRLAFGHHGEIAQIHDTERSGQQFYGWAKITVNDASGSGRKVIASPTGLNPYHAEIILPEMVDVDADEEQNQHALSLAMRAVWLPRPNKPAENPNGTSPTE